MSADRDPSGPAPSAAPTPVPGGDRARSRASGALRLTGMLEAVNDRIGRAIAWLALAMVLVTFLVVVLRYVFDFGSIAMQESVTYMHAVLFMLGAAYTLQRDGHVRVDIFYQRFSRRGRAWVDLLGTLVLLFPICLFILASSWDYVAESWHVLEGSREAGGIPGVFVLKTLLLLMPLLVLIQGAVWVLRNGLFIAGVDAALPEPASESKRPGAEDPTHA
jgi:TRAP-type mannitol/chloroaromatic compound transport system permease small subunit